ncbi:MAG TPA: hypothetical protein VMF61_07435, partial [Candidatus Acidoferrales bacterium]|nr:hypothetical protein [Candidatus Acidoferrales bacterium]
MRRPRRWLNLLCACAVALSGCAGGGQSFTSMMMPPGGGQGGGGSQSVPSGATLVRVHVPWVGPSAAPPASQRFGPASSGLTGFPAPGVLATATPPAPSPGPTAYPVQTMTIVANGPTSVNQTVNLTPVSPGCVPAATGGTVCQAALSLAPGTYTATIATYGSNVAAPSTLTAPAQTIGFVVAPGGNNVVNLSIGAAPAAIEVVPANALANQNAAGGID